MAEINLKIPEGFLNAEERCGHYVSSEMKNVWAVELDLLNEFMRICQKYNIKWLADAGTILGAVRHKGFIPWDDDIDVILMRNEYDKFCEVAKKEIKYPYFFQTEETDPGCMRPHVQIRNSSTTGIIKGDLNSGKKFNQGIFLDVFPIDDIPNDERELNEFLNKIYKARRKVDVIKKFTANYKPASKWYKRPFKALIYYVLKIFGVSYGRYFNKFLDMMKIYNNSNSERVAKLVFIPLNKSRRIWNRKDLKDVIYMPFEFLKIPVPSGYENILNRFYGDWHKFVKGVSTHGKMFFDTERPYTYYTEARHDEK